MTNDDEHIKEKLRSEVLYLENDEERYLYLLFKYNAIFFNEKQSKNIYVTYIGSKFHTMKLEINIGLLLCRQPPI